MARTPVLSVQVAPMPRVKLSPHLRGRGELAYLRGEQVICLGKRDGGQRQPEGLADAVGGAVTDGSFSEASGIASPVATPTPAPAADQPTSLYSPLVLRSLALQVPYSLAHTFDTTSISYR
jgi:hypothetical protein